MTKTLKWIVSIVILAIIVLVMIGYWQHEKYYPSTNDAYVQANIIDIAPEISGKVITVAASNNQFVKKGQLLFIIDPRPYRYALTQAIAKRSLTEQKIRAEKEAVFAAAANVKQHEAQALVAKQTYTRTMTLVKQGQATASDGDRVTSDLKSADANLLAAKSNYLKSLAELGAPDTHNADLKLATANVNTAQLNLTHTKIFAPANGILTRFKIRVGDVVTADQTQFSLIENSQWWVDANYKETELERIKPGQKATITLDIYPDHAFKGIVDSISSGSGEAFSLLPPENASGNWVKVTQRFPVKIRIVNPNSNYPLRVGASATVTIDTK